VALSIFTHRNESYEEAALRQTNITGFNWLFFFVLINLIYNAAEYNMKYVLGEQKNQKDIDF
jgi:hypothetical protein